MQRMCMVKATYLRGLCLVQPEGVGSLGRVRSMQRSKRYWRNLRLHPSGTKGGTVVPPCDFQRRLAKTPVFKGIPP